MIFSTYFAICKLDSHSNDSSFTLRVVRFLLFYIFVLWLRFSSKTNFAFFLFAGAERHWRHTAVTKGNNVQHRQRRFPMIINPLMLPLTFSLGSGDDGGGVGVGGGFSVHRRRSMLLFSSPFGYLDWVGFNLVIGVDTRSVLIGQSNTLFCGRGETKLIFLNWHLYLALADGYRSIKHWPMEAMINQKALTGSCAFSISLHTKPYNINCIKVHVARIRLVVYFILFFFILPLVTTNVSSSGCSVGVNDRIYIK